MIDQSTFFPYPEYTQPRKAQEVRTPTERTRKTSLLQNAHLQCAYEYVRRTQHRGKINRQSVEGHSYTKGLVEVCGSERDDVDVTHA